MQYYLDPFGCAKNQVDAENMMAHLNAAGWSAAHDAADADLVIVNSCGFIQSAKQESINAVLGWRKQFPGKKILLAGCLAQRYAGELAESLPEADGFFGVGDITGIAEAAYAVLGIGDRGSGIRDQLPVTGYQLPATGNWKLETGNSPIPDPRSPIPASSRPLLSLPGSAYVKISEGCDNRCAYCAIPIIRGPLRCRPLPDIAEECKGLLARGVKELCIIGQDIGSYRWGDAGLPELLNAIAEIEGQFWVRLLYMHPGHFPLPVLDLMERDMRFLPYFDIPFQHASQKILSAMNRISYDGTEGTAAEQYLALADTIRSRIQQRQGFPAAVIRTTFLVGFPGETDDDFAALLAFQEKLRPDWLGCFAYSREEGTPAYAMKGQVPQKAAARRKQKIEENQVAITWQAMDRFAGQDLDVLLEEYIAPGEGGNDRFWLGRLYCQAPEVDGAAVITGAGEGAAGDFAPCTVIARRGFDLEAVLR